MACGCGKRSDGLPPVPYGPRSRTVWYSVSPEGVETPHESLVAARRAVRSNRGHSIMGRRETIEATV